MAALNRAAYIHVHDGGPGENDDSAVLRMNEPGQNLSTMADRAFPLGEGEVNLDAGAVEAHFACGCKTGHGYASR
jgi:hypothetical protein